MNDSKLERFLERAEGLLQRLELLLPPLPGETLWSAPAYRWRTRNGLGWIEAIAHPCTVQLEDLLCMERQKREITRNTERFLGGWPANNVLLWGSRGTGKSSLIRALLGTYHQQGLRLLEVDKEDLQQLPEMLNLISARSEHFILYCDDLSFEAGESAYKQLKAALEGSLSGLPENVLIYATSNRRHLLPEYHAENREAKLFEGEIHQGESTEEKISLSERFGLWLSFHPFSQDQYLAIVEHWLTHLGQTFDKNSRELALRWALHRGSRSGRVARQFAVYHAEFGAADAAGG
jgi:uncharacterized protein